MKTTLAWLFTLFCLLSATSASAANDSTASLSASFIESLNEAQQWIAKKHQEDASSILKKLTEQADNSPYESGLVWNMLGYLHYQNNNLKESEKAYEKALTFDIPDTLAQDTRKVLGQVYMSDGNYQRAVELFNQWLSRADSKTEDVHVWAAQCDYQLGRFKDAVNHLNRAISLYQNAGKRPKENWLALLQASLAQVNEVKDRIGTLKLLLTWYPKAEYWLALASAYGQLDKMDDYLAVLALAERKDLLQTETQYLSLAGVYYSKAVPYKAAQVLEEGMHKKIIEPTAKNLRFLATCYSQAQEFKKALTPLRKAAAEDQEGETSALLGNAYFQLARWQEAADAFQQAINKGHLRQLNTVWLLLGQSYINLHQFDRALYAFRQASLDEKHAKQAEQWIRYTRYERKRYEDLGLLQSDTPDSEKKDNPS